MESKEESIRKRVIETYSSQITIDRKIQKGAFMYPSSKILEKELVNLPLIVFYSSTRKP